MITKRALIAGCLFLLAGSNAFAETVTAPAVPQPSQAGDIVGIIVQKTTTGGYLTFGHVFKVGALQPTDTLVARLGTTNLPVQLDVKAKHADGSVRHAALTFSVATISGSAPVMLAKGSAPPPATQAPTPPALIAAGYDVRTTLSGEVVSAATTLGKVTNPPTWLNGPLVREWRVTAPAQGGKLKVTFDVRAYADGSTLTDVIYDNSWFFQGGKANLTYDVTINQGTSQLANWPGVKHYLYAKWMYPVGQSAGNVQYDLPYLIDTGAIPRYDISLGISKPVPAPGPFAPLSTANVTTYMPGTGAREDIGPQPSWVARWIVGQDKDARDAMMANSLASGAVPWHLTDESTGQYLDLIKYKDFWFDGRNQSSIIPANGYGPPADGPEGNKFTPDLAHMPDLNYTPYLITGSHYQLDLMQAEGSYGVFSSLSGYFLPGTEAFAQQAHLFCASLQQQRAFAWGLRSLAEAAYLTPDNDPLKAAFLTTLDVNLQALVKYHITDKAQAAYGAIDGFLLPKDGDQIAPWQQNYIITSLARVVEFGLGTVSSNASQMLTYMTQHSAGYFTNGNNGFPQVDGAAYWLYVTAAGAGQRDGGCSRSNDACPSPPGKPRTTGVPHNTWAKYYNDNVARGAIVPVTDGLLPSYPTYVGGGYPAIARSAMADLYVLTKSDKAKAAHDYLTQGMKDAFVADNNKSMDDAYRADPIWLLSLAGATPVPPQPEPPQPEPPVLPEFPSVKLTAKPGLIQNGQSVVLTWSSTDATTCSGSGFTTAAVSGSVIVKPGRKATYALTCRNAIAESPEVTVKIGIVSTAPKVPTEIVAEAGAQ